MPDIGDKPAAARLSKRHGHKARKSLGQNFIIDRNTTERIADASLVSSEDTVVEIGAGSGALTIALAERARRVVAVEIDRDLIPILTDAVHDYDSVDIINEDFMSLDLSDIVTGDYILVGNLPYYITTPIIMKAIGAMQRPKHLVFMIQKEVAERIASPPGSRVYGAISVAVQYVCKTECVFDVPRTVFSPRPNVDSSVIRLTPLGDDRPRAKDETLFYALVKAGFGQRRKMLRNALGTAIPDRKMLDRVFVMACIDPMSRAETLSVTDFIALADAAADNIK